MKFAAMRQSSTATTIYNCNLLLNRVNGETWSHVPLWTAPAKKESRAKALLECAHKVPVISRIVFIWSGCDSSRRRFSSHRLGPQPPERKIIALIRSIQRISYSYLIAVQFVIMVVVHCTINHRDLVRPAVSGISKGENPSNRLPRLYFAERSGFTA